MSTGHKGTNVLNIFRWKRGSESSLATGLLNDVSPGIELSDYRRIPSPGSESPSGLLNGESPKVEPIADLDLFFERVYSYYREKGLWCIIVKWIVELLSLAFTICFSGFFLLYVDWDGLRKCGMDAVESGTRPCDLAKEALYQHPLTPLTLPKAVILGYLGIFSIYWIFCFLRFFTQLKYTLKIRHFYCNSLHVADNELQTISWPSVLEKVIQVQKMEQLCVVKDLSAHEIVMRLMRKENYLIAMINKGILAFPISKWVPGAGPTVRCGPHAGGRLILTKTLEWILNWSILQSMFDRNFCIRRDFVFNPDTLKIRLMVIGFVMLLLSPFLVIFMLVYLFLRHAEQFYNHPRTASSRRWSNLSRWMFREFNEVEHLFRHRINCSVVHASDYLKQFPSPIISIVGKFISFIAGGFAAVLIIIAFLDESLLEGQIFGRNLLWYAAVFGTITAFSRAAVTDDILVLDPERAMSLVVDSTHYMPKKWRGKENTEIVRKEFETLYQYTAMMWLEEMASIFLTPYLLIFVVPKRVDDILQFISDFTVNVEGVGHVCSFSTFDFQNHGNVNYGSPCNASRTKRSSQGKVEKSFLSFQTTYQSWEPDTQGLQFLTSLRTFRDHRLHEPLSRNTHQQPFEFQIHPNLWENHLYSRNSYLTREAPHDRPRSPHAHMWSQWLAEPDPRTRQLYLLDWYYTSRSRLATTSSSHSPDVPEISLDIPSLHDRHSEDIWMPPLQSKGKEANWENIFGDRSQTHPEASTSASFFKVQNELQEQHGPVDVNHDARSHWWARAGSRSVDPTTEESFLEPPDFNNRHMAIMGNSCCDSDHLIRGLLEEQEHEEEPELRFDWRNRHSLSRTTYTDVIGEGEGGEEFTLHFDDIYRP